MSIKTIGKEFYRSIKKGGSNKSLKAVVPWKERLLASIDASRDVRGSTLVQLATVDATGAPACRTVVFRGWYSANLEDQSLNPSNSALKFITDSRSGKMLDFAHNTRVEVVWWFVSQSEQYRIKGQVQIVDASASGRLSDARVQQWQSLSPVARSQFSWPPSGEPIETNASTATADKSDACSSDNPPENFVLCLIWPTRVKYLNLQDGSLAQDDISSSHPEASMDSDWSSTLVNP